MTDKTYGVLADLSDGSDVTYHIPDERGSNAPFHPVSRCGHVLSRELVNEVPKDGSICKTCDAPEKSSATEGKKADA